MGVQLLQYHQLSVSLYVGFIILLFFSFHGIIRTFCSQKVAPEIIACDSSKILPRI